MDIKGKNVFLSGPMSNVPNYGVDTFAVAHHRLKVAGAGHVFDPALQYLAEDGAAKTHEWYMWSCLRELTKQPLFADDSPMALYYDLLVRLPGCEHSEGAKLEREVAEACGIPVYDLDEVLDA